MINEEKATYFRYWGKADPNYPGNPKWHPLVYHCLDVAAVARTYLKIHSNLLSSLSTTLKATSDDILDAVTFFASFHDIGKLSVPFQSSISTQKPCDDNRDGERSFIGHVLPGWRIWNELPSMQQLRDKIDLSYRFDAWCFASLAHHGHPPRQDGTSVVLRQCFPSDRCDDLELLIEDLAKIFLNGQMPIIGSEVKADYNHASWIIAGLIIIADWIGSNPTWFRYSDLLTSSKPVDTLKMYWEKKALPNAKKALSECGLEPIGVSSKTGMRRLFPTIKQPTELQTLAQTVEITDTPTLFIIEDATGTGKTEAAIVVAHRLMMAGRGDGIYFALPTMATSNRMYERIQKVYRKFYRGGRPSLVLAHSAGATALALERYITTGQDHDEDSVTECSTWIADSRKKALLAHVGVGTIDQALMGALRVKHQSMRLLGLSRKVLVIDEIHACESYVLEILQELLAYHAAQGGSAILLSATIPTGLRMKLVNAFAKGRNNDAVTLKEGSFPLITQYDENIKPTLPIPLPKDAEMDKRPSYRPVKVIAIHSLDQAMQVIKQSISNGKCVCWVRNTVIDAYEAYEKCLEFKPILFHARFTLGDRLRIGIDVETLFGIKKSVKKRRGKLVIATQVIEQSLDVDFDVMITDLSPIDSVIQRAGRLHRHRIRDERVLYILMPDPNNVDKADWYSSMFPRAARFVYPHWGQLWLTAHWLVDHGSFRMPSDARKMIEFVYRGDTEIPKPLLSSEIRSVGDDAADAQMGRLKALDFDEGYSPEGWKTWLDDESAPTRLGAPTSTVVLCKRDESGEICPLHNIGKHGWDASSLTIRSALINEENPSEKEEIAAIKTIRKKRVFVVLSQNGERWFGQAVNKKGEIVKIEYSLSKGLQITEK